MINHPPHRRLFQRDVGVVTEGHNASVRDLLGEEVFRPERLRFRVRPGREGIAAEAVDGHDTKGRPQFAKPTEQEETASRALQEGLTRWRAT
jgi:hypothetical protein